MVEERPLVALAGNPNTGKTSVFNRLTGSDQKVGNYPGITVDRFEGRLRLRDDLEVRLVDIPGTYSLSARSAEEQIACQAIAGIPPLPTPQLVVLVVDATQLLRNLYLAVQVLETAVPVVIALNMVDLLEERGQEIDTETLSRAMGVEVVPVSGLHDTGMDQLRQAIDRTLARPAGEQPLPEWEKTPQLIGDLGEVAAALPDSWELDHPARRSALALWALLSIDEEDELRDISPGLRAKVLAVREAATDEGREIEAEVIKGRYGWIDEFGSPALRQTSKRGLTHTERLDALLLHPLIGFGLFLLVMGLVFQSLFSWSDPVIGLIESAFGALAGGVEGFMPASIFRDFITEGLIAGVGSVVVFLPQILMLFFFIGIMEDTGYMARVAFLMDRIMRVLGLHGRAFVPMLSGFACAVPAIMATRTMERRRNRMLTMMVVPLMSCSARLPVYALLIGALFPPTVVLGFLPLQGLMMVGMYLFSTVIALIAAWVLGKTIFRGPKVPLILELPPYRMPHWTSVARMMIQRAGFFLREAGRVILVCTILIWLLLSFPKNPELDTDYGSLRAQAQETLEEDSLTERLATLNAQESGEIFRASYGARLGHVMEPAIAPLGFDWKMGIGIIGAFAAREVFVSTMGIVYGLDDDVDEHSVTLREKIKKESYADGRPVFTPLVGLSLLVFFALACQCMATLAVVYRETHTWRWPIFLFVYMTSLAWVMSFLVYQGGRFLGFE
jgi:ferrous iron transport protein B